VRAARAAPLRPAAPPLASTGRQGPAAAWRSPNVHFHRAGALLCAAPLVLFSPPASAADDELAAVKAELAATRAQLAATRDALEQVERRLDELEASAAAPAGAPSGPRIPPVNVNNPAISFVVDTIAKTDTEGSGWDLALQSGELFISAPVDPFLRGYASIAASSEEGFDIEEAALITTALPWNLTLKGGRFFADVGRFPHWHVEQLPFVDRPPSIERLIPGESRAQGAELTWLAPTEHYFRVTAGIYDAIGERDELPPDAGSGRYRDFDQLTWLVHPSTYFDLTEALNLELGGSFATVVQDGSRYLYGFDATLRHQPGTSRLYQGFVLGSEWYWNNERFRDVEVGVDPDTGDPLLGTERFRRNGGYAYLESFWGRRYSLGTRFDYAEDVIGPTNRQLTYSAFATWYPSEFQRLRFQFDQIDREHAQNDQRFTLQWTAFLGSHAHGFATR
jgi:hypothetical protein